MLESVKGDEAARIFMSHLGAGRTDGPVRGGECSMGVDRERDLGSLRGLDFLRHLAYRFAELPYENISKIIKVAGSESLEDAMRLPVEVVSDHVERNFGGTCFSLTFLFERVLKALGFYCYKVMADMNSGQNVHCLVVVSEGGAKYMVDPGYALYEVIALPGPSLPGSAASVENQAAAGSVGRVEDRTASRRVACPHALVEVTGEGDGAYSLLTEDASGRKWRYRFRDVPTPDGEFEGHWLESFGKPTLNNICLNRVTPRGHIYLRKDFFKFTSPTSVEKRRVGEGKERLIEEEFGISAEWVEYAQNLLDQKRAAGRVWQRGNPRG